MKKRYIKKMIISILCFSMLLVSGGGTVLAFPLTNQSPKSEYNVRYLMTGRDAAGFTAQFTLVNNTSENMENWTFDFDYNKQIKADDTFSMSCKDYPRGSQYKKHYQFKGKGSRQAIPANGEIVIAYRVNEILNINDNPQNYQFSYNNTIQPSIEILLSTEGLDKNGADSYTETDGFANISGSIQSQYPLKDVTYRITTGNLTLQEGTLDHTGTWEISNPTLFAGVNQLSVKATDNSGFTVTEEFSLQMYGTKGNPSVDQEDNDQDGLQNWEEEMYGLDSNNPDTDSDGLSDYEETALTGTNPLLKDTDRNGITDDLDDSDLDGLSNSREIKLGTNPVGSDSDFDGLNDMEELQHHTNPLDEDTDQDRLTDGLEIKLGMDPLNPDTDGDGTLDGEQTVSVSVDTPDKEKDPLVVPSLEVNLAAGISDSVEIKQDSSETSIWMPKEVPGLLGSAYDFTADGDIKEAVISFIYDESLETADGFNPQIYYIDTENQIMEPLEDQTVDLNNNTVSAKTRHFSKYALVDKSQWDKAWEEEILSQEQEQLNARIDITFVLDESGSMVWNDPQKIRVQVSKDFIDILRKQDKAGAVGFTETARLLFPLTTDHTNVKTALNSIQSSGGTSLQAGLFLALSQYLKPAVTTNTSGEHTEKSMKLIVLLTDGEGSYSPLCTQEAIEKGVKIYTVGLGSSYDRSLLQQIANDTGAKFYHAQQANDLIQEFQKLVSESVDIVTDSDHDELSDYHESRIRLFNGLKIQLDPQNPDTDGDGLLDGEEIVQTTDSQGRVYFVMKSNPNAVDSDGDGIGDKYDPNPLISDKETLKLSSANFVPISVNEENPAYGGNQNWFTDNNPSYTDNILGNYGCGNIAGSNMILYWALQNPNNQNGMTDIAIQASGILKEDFMTFSRWMHETYFPVTQWIGMFGPQVSSGLDQYSSINTQEKYSASWVSFKDKDETLEEIRTMLKQDIPVVMSIGMTFGQVLTLYKDENGTIPLYETAQHFVTITELQINKTKAAHNTMLKVSSWGEPLYMDYDEYVDLAENFLGGLSFGLIHVEN